MALLFDNALAETAASGDTGSVLHGTTWTQFQWVYFDSLSADVWVAGTTNITRNLNNKDSNGVFVYSTGAILGKHGYTGGGATAELATTSTTPAGTGAWTAIGVSRIAEGNWAIYHNGTSQAYSAGGNKKTEGTGHNYVTYGGRSTTSSNEPLLGKIAQLAIWDTALTAGEHKALASGADPRTVRPQSLQLYAPLIKDGQEYIRGADLLDAVRNGGPTPANTHPPVRQLAPPWQGHIVAAAATGRIMSSLTNHGGLAGPGGIAGIGGGLAG